MDETPRTRDRITLIGRLRGRLQESGGVRPQPRALLLNMLHRAVRAALLSLLVVALSACGDDPTFPPEFDASLGVDLASMSQTSSGVYYKDLVVGTGAAAAVGDSATVQYGGWLADGRQFDAGSFTFKVGVGDVIDGFDDGVIGMMQGGKRKIVIPPELGYGNGSVGSIPPNSTLVFDVDLVKVWR